MTTALVIGNGESRNAVDLVNFSKDYITIGCNAIHRDLVVDHLVCCDRRMVEESVVSKNTPQTTIWVRPDWFRYFRKVRKDKRIHCVPDIPYDGEYKMDKALHWGSGPYAVLTAAENGYETIMLLGFDLYGINGKLNNMYKGTSHYKNADADAVDHSYWTYQISKVFTHYPNQEFIIWNHAEWEMPRSWKRDNVRFESLCQVNA